MPALRVYPPGLTVNGCSLIEELLPKFSAAGNKRRVANWKCECGLMFEASFGNVTSGQVKSCGCKRDAATLVRSLKHGHSYIGKATRIYRFWQSMKDRCDNPESDSYPNYGGRGIRCHWSDAFEPFLRYFEQTFGLSEVPKGMSMDRINNDGDYTPGNLRIADMITQANNRRNNHLVVYRGQQFTIAQLSRATGIAYKTLAARITNYGYTVEEAVNWDNPTNL